MNNNNVKAGATLEGDETFNQMQPFSIKKHQLYNIDNLDVPYCVVSSGKVSYGRVTGYAVDFSIYDAATNPQYFVEIANLHHEGSGFYFRFDSHFNSKDESFDFYKSYEIISDTLTLFLSNFFHIQSKTVLTFNDKFDEKDVTVVPYTENRIIKTVKNLKNLGLNNEVVSSLKSDLNCYPESKVINEKLSESIAKIFQSDLNKLYRSKIESIDKATSLFTDYKPKSSYQDVIDALFSPYYTFYS